MSASRIFIVIYAAMIATSFWEAYAEGKNAWNKGKLGWKVKVFDRYYLTAYHFFLFILMFPLLLSLPLVINGWDSELFGILLSAYVSGLIIEDFFWYVVNPEVELKKLNPEFADYYPWIDLKIIKIPVFYIIAVLISVLSWFLFWR